MSSLEEQLTEITDLRVLKAKRASRKGNLTRLYKYSMGIKSTPLHQLKLTDLQKRLESVEENTADFDLIQYRIEELAEKEVIEAEEAEVASQVKYNADLSLSYHTLVDAKVAWSTGTKLKDKVKDLTKFDSLSGGHTRKTFENLTTKYDEFRMLAREMPEQVELQSINEELDPIIRDLCMRLDRDLSEDSCPAHSASSTAFSKELHPQRPRFKIELPSFSGDILHWKDFWSLFTSLIEKEPLSDQEKICHLQTAMKSTEAIEVVRHAAVKGCYDEVVAALQTRYDKNRVVYMHHVSALHSRGTIRSNCDDLIRGKQQLELHRNGLKANKGDTIDQFLVASTVLLMDSNCAAKWADYTSSKKDPPDWETLMNFFEHRISTLQSTPSTSKKPTHSTSTGTSSSKPKDKGRPTVLHARNVTVDFSCPACGEQHSIYQCSTFKGWNVDKRNATARQKHLCFNCLGRGHAIGNCTSKHSCRECSGKHHTLLHKPHAPSTPDSVQVSGPNAQVLCAQGTSTPESGQADSPNTQVLFAQGTTVSRTSPSTIPRTALATVTAGRYQQKARLLLDTGATMSLVTSRLANSLKAKRIQSHTDITGLGGGLTSSHQVEIVLGSVHVNGGETVKIKAHVVNSITSDYPRQDLKTIRDMPFLKDRQLADPEIGKSGRIDLLLGITHCNLCARDETVSSPDRTITAWKTIFGWAIGGETRGDMAANVCLKATTVDSRSDELLQKFWELEAIPGDQSKLSPDDKQATEHFKDTYTRGIDGRYIVQLPRKATPPELGESRSLALRRFEQNEKSLKRKGTWDDFSQAVMEYGEMGHAELVPQSDLRKEHSQVFYLPMHGVAKASSTTTKLRVVFDASAKSTSGTSLNDQLLPGPSMYPLLSSILTKFRIFPIAISADITKMFREVGLHESERDFHRFLFRNDQELIQDWRMTRLTFGVTSSPFLATQVLRQLAEDHREEFPRAAQIVETSFYVDDCLTGTDSLDDAVSLREELNNLLSRGQMTLRKWKSNSQELLDTIPSELKETGNLHISSSPTDCPKALGIFWNTCADTLHVVTPDLGEEDVPTKRQVASAVARTFDILGWYAPATVTIKILLQRLWEKKIKWDDQIPEELRKTWQTWKNELPSLTEHPIPRKLTNSSLPVIDQHIHGFSDASIAAYGGVVYLRSLHADTSVSVTLVAAKSRVAPLHGLTVPKLELSGTLLLSKLLLSVADHLNIPISKVFAWCDSSIVLGWLNMPKTKLKVFVGNRVGEVCSKIPAEQWRYVSSELNPADLASRGVSPKELLRQDLWWSGPPWLKQSPEFWPRRPDINLSRELPEVKGKVLLVESENISLWQRYSSFDRLLRTVSWLRRFYHNCVSATKEKSPRLTGEEMEKSRTALLLASQLQSFPEVMERLQRRKALPGSCKLLSLRPLLGEDGLLRVGGRLQNADLSFDERHPIILDRKSPITKLLVRQIHLQSSHAGPSTMMAIISESFCILGVKRLVRNISHLCVPCRKSYAKAAQQMMGQLPASRVRPAPPFSVSGLDFAGPFLCKRGSPRKPTLVKVYACIFVCFTTKAAHIELVSDLTADGFLAAFCRFVARRGCPSKVYSDNGTNFVGARRELSEALQLLQDKETQEKIHHYASEHRIDWSFSPSRAPHFGGLWEAGVKAMKVLLKKTMGNHILTHEELATVLTEVEATLNSRPLLPLDSTTSGVSALTSGHFLVGRPLRAPPIHVDLTSKESTLKRWNLVKRLMADLWTQWRKIYLQKLQERSCWQKPHLNLQRGDIVLLKEVDPPRRTWPIARILKTYPGRDGLTRVVDILCGGHVYKRPIHKLVLLVSDESEPSSPGGEDVQASRQPSQESN